jgi:hypothetical protein
MTWHLKEYRKNLSKPNEKNIFLLPWGGVVCRNCDDTGELVSYKSVSSYRDGDKPLWLVLSFVLFRENVSYLGYLGSATTNLFCIFPLFQILFLFQGNVFSIYSCSACSSMESVPGMGFQQEKEQIQTLQCIHSKAVETFDPNWDEHWTVADLEEDTDMSYRVFCNQDIRLQTFLEEGMFLAAIQTDGVVTLLFTVGKKQKFPLCSNVNCSKQTKCICFKRYKKLLEEFGQSDDDSNYYWSRRSRPKENVIDHFLESIPIEDHHRKHGYNSTKILYPIKRCPEIQQKFLDRLEGVFHLPESIKPDYDACSFCMHGDEYCPDDKKLIMMSPNLTVYTETSDRIYPIPTYGRPTVGECTCVDLAGIW